MAPALHCGASRRGSGRCLINALPAIITPARKSTYFGLFCLSIVLAGLFSSTSPQAHVISLWPSAGVALTGCIIFGHRFLPAIWLSSLLFNLTTLAWLPDKGMPADYLLPIITACSSTIQVWVNYKILRTRDLNSVNSPDYPQALFFILTALCCCWIAPALSHTTLTMTATATEADLPQWNNLLVWWVGDFLGVILVTPLLLSLLLKQPDGSQAPGPVRGLTLPLLLTIIIFQAAQQYIEAVMSVNARSEFSLKAKVAENSLKRDMNSYLDSLNRLESTLSQKTTISKARFAELVTELTVSMPGIRAMSWNPLITQQQADTFEHHSRRHIDPDFSIKGAPLTPSDPMVVVQLIEPLEKNRMALGFNVFSNAARKQSMLHADRTHAATATDIIQLVQSDKKEPGFLIFAPVYQRLDSVNHSLSGELYLKGFAVGVFLVAEMLQQSISDETINFIDLYIYDNGNPASRVYGDPAIIPMVSADEGLNYTFEMPFAQHRWTFNLHMRPDQVIALQVSSSLTFLLAQAVFASLAVFIILTAFGRNSHLLELVSSRTRELVKLNSKLEHYAFYDSLTGLPNRRLFMDRMQHALALAQRNKQTTALLFMDLNRFKQINDSLGHEAGDKLLADVASRLNSTLRTSDTLARVGGDEFTLLIENDPDPATLASVVDKLIASLQQPIELPGQSVRASISIGVAVFPRDADNLTDLMRAADSAMYQAKQSGQHSCFYQTTTSQHS